MDIHSRFNNCPCLERRGSMATCASNVNVSKVTPPDGINRASIGLPRSQAGVEAASVSSIGIVVRSTVKITPADPVKRLGTGWHWWFSESVHVPIGHKIEFCFRAPIISSYCTMRACGGAARPRSMICRHQGSEALCINSLSCRRDAPIENGTRLARRPA